MRERIFRMTCPTLDAPKADVFKRTERGRHARLWQKIAKA
jgi:hypothetical protein